MTQETRLRRRIANVDVDRDTFARLYLLLGVVAGFAGLFVVPVVYGAVAFVCGLLAVWYSRPAAGVLVAAWGTALIALAGY